MTYICGVKTTPDDIFNFSDRSPDPVSGSLLIAKPPMDDLFFRRSVVLMVEHDKATGSMGVVLNFPTDNMLDAVLPEMTGADRIPLYLGGPVGLNALFFVHTLPPDIVPDSIAFGDGLYFGGDFDALTDYINHGGVTDGTVRFLVGYSGWAKGQLGEELDQGAWAVLDAMPTTPLLTEARDAMWRKAVAHLGDRYRLWGNWPEEVYLN